MMRLPRQLQQRSLLILATLVFVTATFATSLTGCAKKNPVVVLRTDQGDILIEIYSDRAPITAANFLRYVDEGRLEGAHFYRVVHMQNQPDNEIKIEVVQGGLADDLLGNRLPEIEHETTDRTGVLHRIGVISMARNRPGSASSEFFICIDDQPELDFGGKRNPDGQGFAAFGWVIEGIDVVRKIQQLPADGQRLETAVMIHSVARLH